MVWLEVTPKSGKIGTEFIFSGDVSLWLPPDAAGVRITLYTTTEPIIWLAHSEIKPDLTYEIPWVADTLGELTIGALLAYNEGSTGNTVTITIEQGLLPGEFKFIAWSLFEKREIMVKDINGNKYDSGMTVKVKHKAKNFGDVSGKATVEVKDADTGDFVTTYGSGDIIPPGGVWRVDEVEIGKMPKKDWRLEFKVTP